MIKYKVNNIFDNSISLNELLIKVLNIELYKKYKIICKNDFSSELKPYE